MAEDGGGFISSTIDSIIYSPLNLALVLGIFYLLYKIWTANNKKEDDTPPPIRLPPIRMDMTVAELRQYDGTGPDGRVLIGCNGFIFDVTKGRNFYGPGGPYAAFAGRDASRGFATFEVKSSDKEWDDLSDLSPAELDSVKEWEDQFRHKYDLVGKLLKPGETPTDYSKEETEENKKEL